MIHLEGKNLAKEFGYRKIFEGINFKLAEGESLVVVGKNGSGKTTLLKILCRLVRPTRGEVLILLNDILVKEKLRKNLFGYVAPDLYLYDELTALENLEFLVKARGLQFARSDLNRRLDEVGLNGRGEGLVSSFSSGMKQRLKYAFALLKEPEILLLDEPGSNLDEQGFSLLDEIIKKQRENGILILATNDRREIKYGSKILDLDEPGAGGIL